MRIEHFSEQPGVVGSNIGVLASQLAICCANPDDIRLIYFWWVIVGITVIPLLCYGYKQLKINNYLVHNGKTVTAKLHQDETRIIPIRGAYLLLIQCGFLADGAIHIFDDKYAFSRRDIEKISSRVKEADTVLVCTDDSYKKYKILFHSLLHELYNDTQYERLRIINFIVLLINIGLAVFIYCTYFN